tara:strand:- start:848 stop:1204 length:357 start_codon:yes stop_codon:yes gene_type:complete
MKKSMHDLIQALSNKLDVTKENFEKDLSISFGYSMVNIANKTLNIVIYSASNGFKLEHSANIATNAYMSEYSMLIVANSICNDLIVSMYNANICADNIKSRYKKTVVALNTAADYKGV